MDWQPVRRVGAGHASAHHEKWEKAGGGAEAGAGRVGAGTLGSARASRRRGYRNLI